MSDTVWQLYNVTFDDGGTVVGTFTTNSSGNLLTYDLTTTPGSTLGGYDYNPSDSYINYNATSGFNVNSTDGSELTLEIDFDNDLVGTGSDPINLAAASSEMQNINFFDLTRRNITGGSATPLCFLQGTRILTPAGELPVEDLRMGDMVSTLGGDAQPIRWIGTGQMMVPAGHRSPSTPVIVRKGALADGVPHRDLYVTKGHALYLEGTLFPAEFLVNHRSIVWDDTAKEAIYFHIELEKHDVIWAEGAPAETYRDDGNRFMFSNANPAWDRPGVPSFAPVVTGGPQLDAVWASLLKRAGTPPIITTTTEPDLHLLVDGVRVDATRHGDSLFIFPLPLGAKCVIIASRATAQDELGRSRDPRRLGVAISRIDLWCGGAGCLSLEAISLSSPGFHGYEPAEECRWTDGQAYLPSDILDVEAEALHVHVRHTTHYAVPIEQRRQAA